MPYTHTAKSHINRTMVIVGGGNGRRYCALSHCVNVAFPMIKWEDDKPWLIDDLKKLEVVEEYE